MERNGIQGRLRRAAILILAAGLVLLAVGIGVTAFLVNSMVRVANRQMETETEEYRSRLTGQIRSDYQILTTVSSFLEFTDVEQGDGFAGILDEANQRNDFATMAYFPKSGEGVLATLHEPARTGVALETLHPEVQEVVQKAWEGETALSDLFQSEITGEQIYVYGIPVEEHGQVAGALIASDQIEVFSDIFSKDNVLGGNGRIHLINTKGEFLVRSQNAVVQEAPRTIFDGPYFSAEESEQIQTALARGESVYASFRYRGRSYRTLLQPVGINDWCLFCVNGMQDSSDLYRIILVLAVTFIGVMLLMATLLVYGYRLTRRSNRELHDLAFCDPLTGGDNLHAFALRLKKALAGRDDCNVAALNVRQFKFINEIFGRERADRLLCHIYRELSRQLAADEFCCRDSADRFFAFLKGKDSQAVAARLNGIMDTICRTALEDTSSDYRVLLYCGLLSARDCAGAPRNADGAMTRALFALERAKGADRNTVWIYDAELHKEEELANYVESHMHQALRNREFCMYLQPKMDLHSGRLGGAEALVRWMPGSGRILYPDQFIPLFEKNGFCVSLDLYMVECVCRQLRAWMDSGISPVPLSVNQSKRLFFESGYVQELQKLIARYHVPARWITLEILEGVALENPEELNSRIRQLQTIGFRVSMDDFGSGYSSLNTLSRLHIDEVKLDRAFLMEVVDQGNIRSRIIMEQIVQMAKRLGISVVVEGVETRSNEALIQSLDCDFGQGYYYGKPIPADEFTARFWKETPARETQEAAR